MSTSTRFAVAVHILAGMAMNDGVPLRSEEVAKSAHTNAVVIRRLVAMLSRAGFCRTLLGQGGGSVLVLAPKDISLLDVYRAVETGDTFALHREQPDQDCVVGQHIQTALRKRFDKAQEALESELAKVSIAAVVRDIRSLNRSTT